MVEKEEDKKESFAYFNITSHKKLVAINTLSPKYRKYKKILKELEEDFLLLKHLEDNHEIVLDESEKLRIESIYIINEVELKTL